MTTHEDAWDSPVYMGTTDEGVMSPVYHSSKVCEHLHYVTDMPFGVAVDLPGATACPFCLSKADPMERDEFPEDTFPGPGRLTKRQFIDILTKDYFNWLSDQPRSIESFIYSLEEWLSDKRSANPNFPDS